MENEDSTQPIHPGTYLKDTVLSPRALTVTEAARVLDIGRPALSRFLNGKSAVSTRMAGSFETAFGVSAQKLLDMQAAHDGAQPVEGENETAPMPYVPPFLNVTASEIVNWADSSIAARTRLAVLLRTLVNSTGFELKHVDFPGNDDGERPGWDGLVAANRATQWIPAGRSGWEFGTNVDVKPKANSDFKKSVRGVNAAERQEMTFIFVTPRRWKDKDQWAQEKSKLGEWKDVRAYDASDLEQWVEQSAAGQIWIKEETKQDVAGVRSLARCLSEWANATEPELSGALFITAVASASQILTDRLAAESREPTIIGADSVEEALAFLAHLFDQTEKPELAGLRDRVLVFDAPGPLERLAMGSQKFVAIVTNPDVERALSRLDYRPAAIILRSRNAVTRTPHVTLEPIGHDAMRKAVAEMGLDRDAADRVFRESGGSLTVLRRRLSTVPAVQAPSWSSHSEPIEQLIPFAFAGAWDSHVDSDREALALLADDSYENLETGVRRWSAIDDAPLWCEGAYRGVVSKIDLLFAISRSISAEDLKRFFAIARMILDEDDPKLDLPQSDRWMAGLYGKQREFSDELRSGIGETVVLLAVHGEDLFQAATGFGCANAANALVRDVLTPISHRKLEANDRDLPVYSEAAPELFLTMIEKDLRSAAPETHALLDQSDVGIFGGCPRSGLLWALEGLAWNPGTMPRVALILAQLAEVEIKDNWANTPFNSLTSLFCAWMPQTEADHAQRLKALRLVAERHPRIAWRICVAQLGRGSRIGQYSHKPKWRPDGWGFGEPHKEWGPIDEFRLDAMEMAIEWPDHGVDTIDDLIDCLHIADDDARRRIWELVSQWAANDASEAEKAHIREKIRVTIATRRGVRQAQERGVDRLVDEAIQARNALEPSDLILRHEWLFRESWVEESAHEMDDADLEIKDRDERISFQRAGVLREVLDALGLEGILDLADRGNAAFEIGRLLATRVLDHEQLANLLSSDDDPAREGEGESRRSMISGILWGLDQTGTMDSVFDRAAADLSPGRLGNILLLAPFSQDTWARVATLDEQHRTDYWAEVVPTRGLRSGKAANESAVRLLEAGRPRAAFCSLQYELSELRVSVLFQMMSEIANGQHDEPDRYSLDRHYVKSAFALITDTPNLTIEQKAELELAYIEVLSEPWSRHESAGIPNLERYIEEHPEMFVRALVWTYKRRSDGTDPPDWIVPEDLRETLANRGHHLVEGICRIPGCDAPVDQQAERLRQWIQSVRALAGDLDRLDMADQKIGALLSKCPVGEDEVWPNEVVRETLEDLQSEEAMRGASIGVYNARGVIARGEGGHQERELADKYRRWAQALQYSHPFVASRLLGEIVSSYEHEAASWDSEAGVRRRLRT